MPPKRKSDVLELPAVSSASPTTIENSGASAPKKARTFNAENLEPSGSNPQPSSSKPTKWTDIKLEGEDEGSVPIYDDCGEVRRKIRILQKTPGWKVTHWLKEIGGINSNSFNRFMKEKGRTDGASNGTYPAAYMYFEKNRILEGKKKTATRVSNESIHPNGFPLENRRHVWVFERR
ncbi:hypothetical protein BD779DRAFT_22150 [Infundibulicybe gibba]|nr:hypothetical protein BD779DRAFT_22150 [Infundibulicybe gibba]